MPIEFLTTKNCLRTRMFRSQFSFSLSLFFSREKHSFFIRKRICWKKKSFKLFHIFNRIESYLWFNRNRTKFREGNGKIENSKQSSIIAKVTNNSNESYAIKHWKYPFQSKIVHFRCSGNALSFCRLNTITRERVPRHASFGKLQN